MQNFYMLFKLLIVLFVTIHSFGCVWIYIGITSPGGWLAETDWENTMPTQYVSAVYYIVETFTTVGYGDYGASSDAEVWFLMTMELLGVVVFSSMMGEFSGLKVEQTAQKILEKKKEDVSNFVRHLDTARPEFSVPAAYFTEIN